MREPQTPFNQLPKISDYSPNLISEVEDDFLITDQRDVHKDMNLTGICTTPPVKKTSISKKTYKIVCIDDSPTMLNEISKFLDDKRFSIITINNSTQALLKIIEIKPDLILLDITMPNINGYQICSLVRKFTYCRTTPIIMVTANKGLIDRAKARLAGATDYMTKPFSQDDLIKMVFSYLT